MKKFLFLLITLIAISFKLIAQSDCTLDAIDPGQCPDQNAGFVSFQVEGQNTFCETNAATFNNTSTPPDYWDYFIIDFGDGKDPVEVENYDQVNYLFDFENIDRCEEGPIFQNFFCYLAVKECAAGTSTNWAQGTYRVELKPVSKIILPDMICAGEDVTFESNSCNESENSYIWKIDGVVQSGNNETFTTQFQTTGPHTITLTVSNTCGDDTQTIPFEVIGVPETDLILINGGLGCSPDRQQVTFIPDQWITSQRWEVEPEVGDGWCFVENLPGTGDTIICQPDPQYLGLYREDTLDMSIFSSGEYVVTLFYGNQCEDKEVTDTIYIYAPPTVFGFDDITRCDEAVIDFIDLGLTFGGDITQYVWTFSNGHPPDSSATNPDFGEVTFTSDGTITLELRGIDPCDDITQEIKVTVITTGNVNVPDLTSDICSNDAPIPLNPSPPSGIYLYNGNPAPFIRNDTLFPVGLMGDYTVTYLVGEDTDCPADTIFSFTILEGPFIELGEYAPFCQTATNFNPTIGMTSSGDINTWNWQICDVGSNVVEMSNATNPTFDINMPGEYSVKVTVSSNECGTVSDTSSLFIQANVPAMITDVNTVLCQGSSPIMLEATPPGGTWSGASGGVFDPTGLPPDMYMVTYSIASGACSSFDDITFEVVASAVVMAVDTFFCIEDVPAMLEVFPVGGTFSGDGDIVTEDGVFSPEIAGVGRSTVFYNYVDDNDCEINVEINVEVDDIPMIAVSDTIFICIDPNDVDLSSEVNTFGVEGTLTFDGIGIIDEDGIFNGNGLSSGFYDIDVTFTTRSCVVEGAFVVELGEKPELIMPADTTVCVDGGSLILNTNVDGGVWSSNDCLIDPNTGEIDVEDIGEATCTFTYTLSEGTSCEQSGEVTIEILDLNNDIEVPPHANVCFANDTYTFSGFSPSGGMWMADVGIIDATNGIVDISLLEPDMTYTFTYCIESQVVQDCDACKSTTLYIAPLPTASFMTDVPPCQNDSFNLINNSEGAVMYEWDFGDGNTSNSPTPTHTYVDAGDFDLQLIAITSDGCRDTLIQEIHVTPPPTLDIEIMTEEGCAPLEVDYVNNSNGENIEQYWIIGGIDTLFEANPDIVLDGVQTDSLISIEFWVVNDCAVLTDSVHVLVHPYPIVNFGVEHRVGCSPDTIDFMNTTTGNPTNTFWDFGNGNTSTEEAPGYQVYTSPDDSVSVYYATLTASNMCGDSTIVKPITINPNDVDAFFEPDVIEGCPPLTVCVTNYSTPTATVIYAFGDGGTSLTPDTCYTYNSAGVYTIMQSAELCGIDFYEYDIIVHPSPQIEVEILAFACAGDSVAFINSSADSITTWSFGDGNTANDYSPTHVYESPGTYIIEVTMYTDSIPCPAVYTDSIIVREQPTATPLATPGTACPGDAIQFNVGIPATNYAWDFGDGQGETEANPTHTYSESGTYEVTLTVYDEFDCPSDSTILVIIHEAPKSQFALSANEICQFYDTLIVVNQSTEDITSEWYLNGTFYTNQNDSLTFTPDESGIYEVMLISESAFGCRDTFSRNFEVLASPVAEILALPTEGCEPLIVDFTDNSQSNEWTLWTFSNNDTSTETNTSFTYDRGEYSALLTVGGSNGCPDDMDTVAITVNPRAIADFTVSLSDSCGIPANITLDNLSEDSKSFAWDFGDGTTSINFEPSHTYTSSGGYTIELTTNNIYNCPDTAMTMLDVFSQPTAGFSIPESRACEGDTLQINDSSMGATDIIWLVNGEVVEGEHIILTEAGNYAVSQIAVYQGSCFDNTSISQTVFIYEAPTADFSYIVDSDPDILGDVQFTNESTDADGYLWNFGDNTLTSTEINPYHEFRTNPPSEVVLTAFNYNNGVFTCVDSTSELIDYEKIHTFYAPNALSPDQSFGNELVKVFRPVGLGVENYKLEIFSPWGDIVATLDNVENGSPNDEWDGTYRGKVVPQGAYLWTAKINYTDGHYEFKKGTVTVIR